MLELDHQCEACDEPVTVTVDIGTRRFHSCSAHVDQIVRENTLFEASGVSEQAKLEVVR